MKLALLLNTLLLACTLSVSAATKVISQSELLSNQSSGTPHTIIDVRSPEEFNDGHLAGAINIPFDEIEKHQSLLTSLKDKTLVVYCRSGRRAGIFEEALTQQGFNLLHLEGDFIAWQKAGLELKE